MTARPSVGARALPLVERLVADADMLRIRTLDVAGARVVDAGVDVPGSPEAGRRIAEIAMGGLGTVVLQGGTPGGTWPCAVAVQAAEPVTACLLSQYAGWALTLEDDLGRRRTLMVSGPGRARARREALFDELGYADGASPAVFVVEDARLPDGAVAKALAEGAGVDPADLVVIVTPTTSIAGLVQIAARVLEVALHRVHELGFPVERVRDGTGWAPVPPPSPDFVTAMGRSNDAILYGGEVWLTVEGPEEEARALARALPSSASPSYGRPFAELFRAAGGDFYAIDRSLFAPARVVVTALATGRSFTAGRIARDLLSRSFGVAP
ncbi:Methenyltetrahydromethanopterin cyclohydrolase [bacterium HR39]|nr:Methenyltetrahydromethanopterin cyclohydrolase [bacterium HR39]